MTLLRSLAVLLVAARAAVAGPLLAPGDAFPAWTLPDQNGKSVSSAELAGRTYLLWFYPKAMTPGCTMEGRGLRDDFPAFQTKGVEILGVSFDAPEDNAAFVKAENFPFRLLADRDRVLAIAVGAADAKDQAVPRRISYLVGSDGKVREVYGSVNPQTHAKDVLGDLGG